MNRKQRVRSGAPISTAINACWCAGPGFRDATTRPSRHAPREQPANDEWHRAITATSTAERPSCPGQRAATAGSAAPEDDRPELPRQAIQHIAEARRLFSDKRYSDTIRELGRALRYNATVAKRTA
jgi:hypothetical protein